MRIVSGSLKGREFKTPHGHRTHPMGDKAKGSLFNVLGDISGLKVLDAFAGSGALAFEAASRGAKLVVAIDKDTSAHKVIEQNVKELNLQKLVHVTKANTAGWSLHNMENQFDIVLMDPPYDQLQPNLLKSLVKRHIKLGALAVLSWPGKQAPPKFEQTEIAATKPHGDIQLVFYRRL